MKSLAEQLDAYAAYHHDRRNTITHFIGVPLVAFMVYVLAYRRGGASGYRS